MPLHQTLRRLDIRDNPQLAWTQPLQDIFCNGTGSTNCYRQLAEL